MLIEAPTGIAALYQSDPHFLAKVIADQFLFKGITRTII